MAVAASRGLGLLLSWHQTHAEREDVVRRYDAALAAAAWEGPRPTHVGSAVAFIGGSREAARAELRPGFVRTWLAQELAAMRCSSILSLIGRERF